MAGLTYKKAGVDIEKASAFKKKIKYLVRKSFSPSVLGDIGGFGSFFRFAKEKYKDPVLVSSTDGVGTKLKVAFLSGRHDTVGIDLVAMNVNDILCTGARPLFFLDYIASGKLEPETLYEVVKSINEGCVQAGCSLIGGETAEMPDMYKRGEYDLAGFCVGVVDRALIIDGRDINPGDVIIGLESNGLHSNGFSLVRKALSQTEIKRMQKELLRPTRIYVKPVLTLLEDFNSGYRNIKGIAHITGGAFYDKIARILPADVNAKINKGSWKIPEIFRLIQNKAHIKDEEMYRTFNMGIGMVLVVDPKAASRISARLAELNLKSWVIGEVTGGKKKVEIV
ncbi:MAG: phosphoribosylformylglycinamidine cyclo-ligase [Deltaproteobacteria bacterium]